MLGIPKIWASCNVHIVGAPLELANNSFGVELKQFFIVIHQEVKNLDMNNNCALKEFLKHGLWSYLPFFSSHTHCTCHPFRDCYLIITNLLLGHITNHIVLGHLSHAFRSTQTMFKILGLLPGLNFAKLAQPQIICGQVLFLPKCT
jgi:hypothetical protein